MPVAFGLVEPWRLAFVAGLSTFATADPFGNLAFLADGLISPVLAGRLGLAGGGLCRERRRVIASSITAWSVFGSLGIVAWSSAVLTAPVACLTVAVSILATTLACAEATSVSCMRLA